MLGLGLAGPLWGRRAWRGGASRIVLTGLLLALALYLAGPRNDFGPDVPSHRTQPPAELSALDGWLQRSEAAYPDLRPGVAKGVVWQGTPGQRTGWAVVNLHGYSASRLETAPLAETVAKQLGANLYQSRLSGHGRSSEAMGEVTAQDWLADAVEAARIGGMLGDKVLVVGVSSGATLATWLAMRPEGRDVAAYAFISPNYGPKNKRAELINTPWGRQLALLQEGEMRGQASSDPREAQAWTHRHPTRALFPMMALVKHVRESDLSRFTKPVLVLYSERDQTVDPAEIREVFARLGSEAKTLEAVTYSESAGQHVLAGDIRAPRATAPMARRIADWAQALPNRRP